MLLALGLIQGNLDCFGATWCNSGYLTLFWRKLQNVVKYAFFVLFLGAQIFIRAILYAFSISALDGDGDVGYGGTYKAFLGGGCMSAGF